MTKAPIAIVSAGEMGGAIGGVLNSAGIACATTLLDRGDETRARAIQAKMHISPDLSSLVGSCDLFLSVLPPAAATHLAEQVSNLARASGKHFTFVEANAIAPTHAHDIARLFSGTNVTFIDAGIIGSPPNTSIPRLYVSGPNSTLLNAADGIAFNIRHLGPEIGRASGMKMSYAAITKGVNALLSAAFLTAERLDLLDELQSELATSQDQLFKRATANIPRLPADAARWAPEMHEISKTFQDVGTPSGFHSAAADMMEILAQSQFGHETRRTRDMNRDAATTIKGLK